MTISTFPTLPGQGWSVMKTPMFSTRVAPHVSGREVRVANYAHGLYAFELGFNGLDSNNRNAGLQRLSLQTLMAFYNSCQGQFAAFLYVDPTDNFAGNAVFGTGDGTTTAFTLCRPLSSSFSEPASYVTSLANATVNGVVTAATLTAPNTITFGSAPAASAVLAATFNFAFKCRFLDDSLEFENFMVGLWSVKSLKFRSVR